MTEEKKDVEETTEKKEEKKEDVEETTEKKEEEKKDKEEEVEEEEKEEEDEDVYEARFKELENDNEELKKNKAAAISEERGKRKKETERADEAEEKLKKKEGEEGKYLTEEEADKIFDQKLGKQREMDKVDQISSSPSEKKLILKIMETKNVSADDAKVLANSHIIEEHQEEEREREAEEDALSGFSAGQPKGSKGGPAYKKDAVKKKAAEGMTPEEAKYLDKV